jgi:HAD-hyrolase-like
MPIKRPRGILVDYGGTLVEELQFDTRLGTELLLSRAQRPISEREREAIFARADRVSRKVAERRDRFQIETPWSSLTRLIYDCFGIRFVEPLADLEMAFWDASVRTRPIADALAATKPNPLIFEAAAGLLGIDVADTWFVGDRLDTDIAGARSAGMTAVWYGSTDPDEQSEAPIVAETWSAVMKGV